MANAKRPKAPIDKDMNGLVHNNEAPFSPQTLEEISPGGMVSKKGGPNQYFNADGCENGTGRKLPNWP